MFTRQDSIIYSQKFIDKILSKGINLKYAKLFGSYASNHQHNDSDIDIALAADEFIGLGFIDIDLFVKELIEFDLIQVKTYNTEYFEIGDPFIDEIKRTGISLKVN
jgi:predicted nucleotidyltransferase